MPRLRRGICVQLNGWGGCVYTWCVYICVCLAWAAKAALCRAVSGPMIHDAARPHLLSQQQRLLGAVLLRGWVCCALQALYHVMSLFWHHALLFAAR